MRTRQLTGLVRYGCIFTVCFLALGVHNAFAQRMLYVVCAFDTADKKLAEHARADAAMLTSAFEKNCVRGQWKQVNIKPEDLTREKILDTIAQIPLNGDDAIVFLYCGHGAYRDEGREHFFVTQNQQQWIRRSEILDAMNRKSPRLAVLLSNACFNYVPSDRRVEAGVEAPKRIVRQSASPLFETLFYRSQGVIDVTACKNDERAYGHSIPSSGNLFFSAVTQTLNVAANDAQMGWQGVIDQVKGKVRNSFQKEFQGQELEDVDTLSGAQIRQRTQTVLVNKLEVTLLPPTENGNNTNIGQQVYHSISSVRLGVTVQEHNGPGVALTAVNSGGPAMRCFDGNGNQWMLMQSDFITEINSERVTTLEDFIRLVRGSPTNMNFICVGSDDRKTYSFAVQLNDLNGGNAGQPQRTRFGAFVQDSERGVQVTGVVDGSPATRCIDQTGKNWFLEAGDIITHVNGIAVRTEAEYRKAVADSPQSMALRLVGGRDNLVYQFSSKLNY